VLLETLVKHHRYRYRNKMLRYFGWVCRKELLGPQPL
jgi:hypothetical protein